MHMILTGDSITAKDAEKAGLVAKIYPDDQVLSKAIEHGEPKYLSWPGCLLRPSYTAQTMSNYSEQVVTMAKEAVNQGKTRIRFYETIAENVISNFPPLMLA